MCRNVMGTENGYVLHVTLESLELKTAFFSNATKNKHDKDCGTSFDVAILIKTGTSFDFRKLKTMIQNCIGKSLLLL